MKQAFILSLIFGLLLASSSMAQERKTTGTVKNENGDGIPSALIQEKDSKIATYTDSLGNFSLVLDKSAPLLVVAKGYKDETVQPKDKLVVVLKRGQSSAAALVPNDPAKIKNGVSATNNSTGFSYFNVATTGGGGLMYNIKRKEDTRGSRYLIPEGWAAGYVVDKTGNTIKNENYSFNYDKISGALLLTQDKRAAVEVGYDQVKSFTIYDATSKPHTYQIIPGIDKGHYTELLVDGVNYRAYKLTKTSFKKADYKTDGLTSSGSRYDEYVDEPVYYVENVKTPGIHKIALRAKALKQVFANDNNKVKQFFDEHTADDIDEAFLINLVEFVNK